MTSATYYGILLMGLTLGLHCPRVSGQCDGTTLELTATGPPQYLRTPNYPSNYPASLEGCSWWITSNSSKPIVFNVEDIFTDNCTYDYFDVYDGDSTNDTFLGSFCSDEAIFFISNGSSLYLEFPPDGISSYRISALFFIPDDALKPACNSTLSNATAEPQYIMSQSLPDPYAANDDCWYIVYPSTPYYGVSFSVVFLDIYGTSYCVADSLRIYSVANDIETVVYWYCNDKESYANIFTEPFDIGGDYLMLRFTSDGIDTGHRGYYMSYTEIYTEFEMAYPDENETLYLSIMETEGGTINDTVGFLLLNFTGTLMFEFTEVNGVQHFTLEEDPPESGRYMVKLIEYFDYETVQEVTSLLSVTTSHIPQLTWYVPIHLSIIDEDDNAPTFLNLPGNVTVERAELAGLFIYQVLSNDSDITDDYKNVSYSIASSADQHGLLSIDSETGEITLANDAEIMPSTITRYEVSITATSIVGGLNTVEKLIIILPVDLPPNCTHAGIFADPLNNDNHDAFMDIEFEEPWSCTDEFEITYAIGTVHPSLSSPLFDIDEKYGDLWLVRKYTEDELDDSRSFQVEVVAIDRISQPTSIYVTIDTTDFGCFPNPQILNARMGEPPGTVLKTDFNCTDNTGLDFVIQKQYPSNAFQMVTYPDGKYALILIGEVYKIHFYSLVIRVIYGGARVALRFQVIVQTNICTVDEVNSHG